MVERLPFKEHCLCKAFFSEENRPMKVCGNCHTVRCAKCVAALVGKGADRLECPCCLSLVKQGSIRVDEQTDAMVELISKREAETTQRYAKQVEVLKESIRQTREKEEERRITTALLEREVSTLKTAAQQAHSNFRDKLQAQANHANQQLLAREADYQCMAAELT
jgi:Fe2+ transport system protein B